MAEYIGDITFGKVLAERIKQINLFYFLLISARGTCNKHHFLWGLRSKPYEVLIFNFNSVVIAEIQARRAVISDISVDFILKIKPH